MVEFMFCMCKGLDSIPKPKPEYTHMDCLLSLSNLLGTGDAALTAYEHNQRARHMDCLGPLAKISGPEQTETRYKVEAPLSRAMVINAQQEKAMDKGCLKGLIAT